MFFKGPRPIINILLLSGGLFAVLTLTGKFTVAQQNAGEEKIWEVPLSTNVRGAGSIPIENKCKQDQTFSVVSELPYLSFPAGATVVVPGKQTKKLSVIFDTRGLKPGKHIGSAKINCDSCGQSNCSIKQQTLRIILVLTEPLPAQTSPSTSRTSTPPAQTSPSSSQNSPARGQADLPKPGQRMDSLSAPQLAGLGAMVNMLGPQISETHSADEFSIFAFATGGAPGVVEFTTVPGDSAMLTIEVNGARPFTQILKGPRQVHIEVEGFPNTSQASAQPVTLQIKFKLPDEFGKQPQIASISIRPLGSPKNFVVDGIGLGYQAVGSVTIDQLTFQPAGSLNYVYNFRALRDFEKWGTEILQMTRAADNRLLGTRVKTGPVELKVDRGTQKNGSWDGRNDGGQISHGNHKVQVRVWRTANNRNGGDWVVRISQQQVQVQ